METYLIIATVALITICCVWHAVETERAVSKIRSRAALPIRPPTYFNRKVGDQFIYRGVVHRVVAIHQWERRERIMVKKDLVQIIRDNPGGVFIVDNDWWEYRSASHKPEEDPLAQCGQVSELGDGGYGSGDCYGGDILQALAVIVGVKVESV